MVEKEYTYDVVKKPPQSQNLPLFPLFNPSPAPVVAQPQQPAQVDAGTLRFLAERIYRYRNYFGVYPPTGASSYEEHTSLLWAREIDVANEIDDYVRNSDALYAKAPEVDFKALSRATGVSIESLGRFVSACVKNSRWEWEIIPGYDTLGDWEAVASFEEEIEEALRYHICYLKMCQVVEELRASQELAQGGP